MDFNSARQTMVDTQLRVNDVTDPALLAAFQTVPKEKFLSKSKRSIAYGDLEIETSPGRSMWKPRDFAKLLQACAPAPSDIAMVIGAGAGYEAAILSQLVETVMALESDPVLVKEAADRLNTQEYDRAVMIEGDLEAGLPDEGPFDLIFVNGMVETIPEAWGAQLAEGGRMGVFVQSDDKLGVGRVYRRAGNTVSHRNVFDACPPIFEAFSKAPAFNF